MGRRDPGDVRRHLRDLPDGDHGFRRHLRHLGDRRHQPRRHPVGHGYRQCRCRGDDSDRGDVVGPGRPDGRSPRVGWPAGTRPARCRAWPPRRCDFQSETTVSKGYSPWLRTPSSTSTRTTATPGATRQRIRCRHHGSRRSRRGGRAGGGRIRAGRRAGEQRRDHAAGRAGDDRPRRLCSRIFGAGMRERRSGSIVRDTSPVRKSRSTAGSARR